MKTIEISDELYRKLEKISKEMGSQNHRGTAQPYIFRQSVKSTRPAYDWCWDITVLYKDWEEYFRGNQENYLRDMYEYIENNLKLQAKDWSFEDEDDVIDFLLEHGFEKWELEEFDEYKWYFLTQESAKRHWELNKHHYWEEFRTYLDHCWRDPDMGAVQQFLCELTWGTLHK